MDDTKEVTPKSEEIHNTQETTLEKREKKLMTWIKNPYNFSLLVIITLTVIIRIYYFVLTYNQPLWWDEAEYMVMARRFAFGIPQIFDPVRQLLLPVIIAGFLKISSSELLPRLLILLLSISSILAVYFLGKEIYNKKVGLISAFLMAFLSINMFYSFRILEDIPSLAFFTFASLFFYRYFKYNKKIDIYIASVIIGLGTLFKLSTAYLLAGIFFYILITQKLTFLKKKELWISALIFWLILTPYLIFGYFEFGGFVLTKAANSIAPKTVVNGVTITNTSQYFIWGITNIKYYFINLANFIFPAFSSELLIYLGIIIMIILFFLFFYKLFLSLDLLFKTKENENLEIKSQLFLLFIIIFPLILASVLMTHPEDRYILNIFPAIFIIISFLLLKFYSVMKIKKMSIIAMIIIGLILISYAYVQYKAADNLIKVKLDSYSQVKDAGIWINENTKPGDIIVTSSPHQIKYYSDRQTISFPPDETDFENAVKADKPVYYMVSAFEPTANWTYTYPQENNLTIVQAYFADAQKTQPLIIIYGFPKNFNLNKANLQKSSINTNSSVFSKSP